MKKINEELVIEQEVREVREEVKKEFDPKDYVLYPSSKTKIKMAMIDVGEDADFRLNDIKGKANPNCTVFTVNSLHEPFNGSRKVISGKRLIQYTPSENVVRGGSVVAKKGEVSSYYNKFGECVFTDLNAEWSKAGDKNKYRRSGAETYFLAHVFTITDMEKNEVKEINQPCLVGFNVMDLYSLTAKATGVGESLQSLLSEDEDGEITALTYPLTYTAGKLEVTKKPMTKDEQALIDELREKKDELLNEFKHLMPIPYKVLKEAIDKGEYELSYPHPQNHKSTSKTTVDEDGEVIPF